MEFITKLSGVNVSEYGLSEDFPQLEKLDYETEVTAQVEWSFHVDSREWGIKEISAYTTNVVIDMDITVWSNGDTNTFKSIQIDTSLDGNQWGVENNILDLRLADSILPQDVEIDFHNKIITVNY